ncbi:hypothetical protein [Nocardioides currus]|uniref:Uncharacterized protein n=1 Tax=Nocardioides currus TaxID=2133958 RepID=A0A2R7YSC4_9ACTN|nr:hypothetical protein [Nocardioides currus]PUA79203.1 hypothetical protein C7S10_20955 [Nocardioides currus]
MASERERLDQIAAAVLARIDARRQPDRLVDPRAARIDALLGDPSEITPEELILRTWVDGTDRDALVARLSEIVYTDDEHAPYPADGARRGTWWQVRSAMMSGYLTQDELDQIAALRTRASS